MARRRRSTQVAVATIERAGELPRNNSNRLARLPRAHENVLRSILGLATQTPTRGAARPVRAVYPGARRELPKLAVSRAALTQSPAKPTRLKRPPLYQLNIQAPSRVKFCVRRKIRREVMFARNMAGRRGIGRGKTWRRSENSNYSCWR